MRFKIGQEVTPTKRNFEVVFGEMGPQDLPEFGKVYKVSGYPLADRPNVPERFRNMMSLEEKPQNKIFDDIHFEPLISDEKLEADIKELDYV